MPRSAACAPRPGTDPAVPSPPRLWAAIAPPASWSALRAGWAIPPSCCVPTVRNSAGRSSPMGQPNRCCASSGRWTAAGISSVSAGEASLSLPGTAVWISTGAAGRALSRGDPPEHRRCLPDSAADPAPGRLTPLPLTQCFLPPFPQCPCPSVVTGQGASFLPLTAPVGSAIV